MQNGLKASADQRLAIRCTGRTAGFEAKGCRNGGEIKNFFMIAEITKREITKITNRTMLIQLVAIRRVPVAIRHINVPIERALIERVSIGRVSIGEYQFGECAQFRVAIKSILQRSRVATQSSNPEHTIENII